MINSSAKRKIFGPLPEHQDFMPIRLPPIATTSDQIRSSPSAEEILEHSSSFLLSIETVLQQIQRFDRGFKIEVAETCLERVKQLIKNSTLDLKTELLHEYHKEIVGLQQTDLRYKQFKASCITNLNDPSTKLELQYTEKEAFSKITDHIQQIRELRERVQEKLFEFEYQITGSKLLPKQQTLDSCVSDLQVYISRHNTQINTLMLNLLINIDQRYDNFNKALNQFIVFHCRLESITDNMQAIQCQKDRMKDYASEMANHFQKVDDVLDHSRFENAIAMHNQANQKFRNLAEVYESNCKLFIRMSSEAYTPEYSSKVASYRESFIQFNASYKEYLKNCGIFDNLLKNLIEANDVGRRAIAHPNDTDKGKLKRLHANTLGMKIPPEVSKTKERVLQLIEKDMNLLKEPLPVRNKVQLTNEFFKLQIGQFIKYFERLEDEGMHYLMNSKQTMQEYRYELYNMRARTESQQNIINDYIGYFNLALVEYQFLTHIRQHNFSLLNNAFIDLLLTKESPRIDQIFRKIPLINQQFKQIWRGMPVGLQKCLYNSLRDVFILTSFFYAKGVQQIAPRLRLEKEKFRQYQRGGKKITAAVVNNMISDLVLLDKVDESDNQSGVIKPSSVEKIFLVLRQIHTMSDDNKLMKMFLLDNFLSIYKFYINLTLDQLKLNSKQLQTEFIYQGQNNFFEFFSLYVMNHIGNYHILPNFFSLVQTTITNICSKWKVIPLQEKIRTMIRLSMLLDVLQNYDTKIVDYNFYKETLLYFHRLLRSHLELESIAANYQNLRSPGEVIRTIVYTLTILKQMQQLTYLPSTTNSKSISNTLLEFAKSLKEQSPATIGSESDIKRIFINMDALKSQIDLQLASTNIKFKELLLIQKLAILYFYLNSMKKLIESRQLMQPTDRLKLFVGDKFEIFDFTKTKYYTMAEKILIAYTPWVSYIFNILRDRKYSIDNNEPKDANLASVVNWALK